MLNSTLRIGGSVLPVESTADLLVVGASFGGIALAWAAARAGHSVVVVEPRTYPGYETTATLRPWLSAASLGHLPALFAPWLSEAAPLPAATSEIPLYPDALKLGMEDMLLEAGVKVYYASLPCGAVFDEVSGVLAGAVIGNKSGRQVILARAIVDTTEWATLARLAGETFHCQRVPATVEARRTLEFTGVAEGLPHLPVTLPVPQHLGIAGNAVRLHPGYLGHSHVLVECPLALTLPSADAPGRMAMEIEARRRTMDLAAHLVGQQAAFGKAYLAHASWELWVRSPWQLAAPDAHYVRPGDLDLRSTIAVHTEEKTVHLPLAGFASPEQPNLVVLSSASAVPQGIDPALLLRPAMAAQAGEALLPYVEHVLQRSPMPESAHCTVRCSDPVTDGAASDLVVREPEAPQRGRTYARVAEGETAVPLLTDVDVLVVGGGTSGATAGAVAAAQGARTAVLELNSGLGGTGTVGGVDSYWYGRRVGFTETVDRYYQEEASRLGLSTSPNRGEHGHEASRKWNIEAKMHGLLRWMLDSGAQVFFRSTTVGALVEAGDPKRVRGVLLATPDGLRAVRAKVVIDATGDADLAAFAGGRTVYGSVRDRLPLWYSLAQFARPGLTRNNFTSSVDVSNINDYTRAILAGRRRGECHDHGTYVAPRESRHIVGGITLTLTDQLTFRQFPDTINICFSNSDIKGKSATDWVLWGLLPPNVESEIPYRAVVPEDLDGLLVCGKAMSCTHDALPAIRMQADLQNLGGACALAATLAVQCGVEPRDVDLRTLQQELVRSGVLPEQLLDRTITADDASEADLQALVDGLTGDEPFYIDMGINDVQREPMTLVRVCSAGPRIVPLLEQAYERSAGKRRLLLARLLAWYGSAAGLGGLTETIEAGLDGGSLPRRETKIRHAGLPPDQGAMPELCYLINALGLIRDRAANRRILHVLARIVDLLHPTPDDFRDRAKGTFHYVESVCNVAERLGDAEAIPILLALHGREGLHGLQAHAPEPDFFLERMAYLEVCVARALARCGAPEGAAILADYLSDARAILAEHAHDELIALSGRDFGKDGEAWRRWIDEQPPFLNPRPWTQRID